MTVEEQGIQSEHVKQPITGEDSLMSTVFFVIGRCWFGKRAGVYTDYIYQGPMILVLLVGTHSVHLKHTSDLYRVVFFLST